jgi:pantothenate kinase type III
LGGFILAGRQLARQALSSGTGQLPDIGLTKTCPPPIGGDTERAMQAGIDVGLLGAVERLVRETLARQSEPLSVVAVGGDRDYFCRHLPDLLIPGPDDFTLSGLAHVAKASLAGKAPEPPSTP